MFSFTVWKKYFFRVLKIITLVFLCHQVINAKILGKQPKNLKNFYLINNILCILAGTVNMSLHKPSLMGDKKNRWINFHNIKLITAIIFFTPIVNILPISKTTRINIQFYWIIASMILAPLARYYRQYSMVLERQREKRQRQNDD